MQIVHLEPNSDEWLEWRHGRITGSKLKDIVVFKGNAKKDGFYQLVADRMAIQDDGDSSSRERGHELEEEALNKFEEETGKKVVRGKELGVWISDDNENIAVSPDGGVLNKKKIFTESCEVKSLAAKHHLRAIHENRVGTGFWLQMLQYFIVNDDLKKHNQIFYDPRVTAKPYHVIEFFRKDLVDDIQFYKDYQNNTLKEVEELVERLTF